MGVIAWVKEHFEMLAAGTLGVFSMGGLVVTHYDHGNRIKDLETESKETEKAYNLHLLEMKGDIKVLLERTKHL